ncbi:DENN domain-containing protein 1B [Conger conger]|uniref:DENN domain-containing protein 1B n=1 Tax=Conger conger TaxID=82655 RepID=UPI002A5A4B5A|nr:DENN domain-containing protein 1B [Conger conger]
MGSRLKENPEGTFYWFFEATCPIANDKDPGVIFQFPEDFSDEESLQALPRFCFPYDIERVRESVAIQHFTFVLTDLEGCQRFGFCRLTSSSRTCLCILSYLPWFEVFYKLLNNLADCRTKGQTNEMRALLSTLYKHPVPEANSPVTLQLEGEQLQVRFGAQEALHGHSSPPLGKGGSGIPYFIAPDPRSLPSIPESRNLTEFVVAVDVSNLLQLYASMLFERRILISSSKLSTLTACVHACTAMLYPMYWQHIFIPVLPLHLLDYCCAPMPYIIGVHSSLMERVRSRALEDVVVLNVDTNTMESPFEDLKRIPSDVLSLLKVRLKKQSAAPGAGVARAFLKTQALLFGGYKDALLCPSDGAPVRFCEESFVNHKSHSVRQFLESAVHLQFFKQFIDGRLELMNRGIEPVDLFEEEILQSGESPGGRRSYQQLVGNLKKGGGALILTVKSKASMCKSAKVHAKSSLKNFLSSKEENEVAMLYRGGSLRSDAPGTYMHRRVQSDCLQSRLPITQHFGMSRPRRPARRYNRQPEERATEKNSTWSPDWEDEPLEEDPGSADSVQVDEADGDLLTDPEEMDLLGEIFDTLSCRSVHERGYLYGTRSLDLFGPDSADYITRKEMVAPSQESLSASFGRSGSLLSWGQEDGPEEEEGPDAQGEEPVRQKEEEQEEEGPDAQGEEPVRQKEEEQEEKEDQDKDLQEEKGEVRNLQQEKTEKVKEEQLERQQEVQSKEVPQDHQEGNQPRQTGSLPSPTEPEAAPTLSAAPGSEMASGDVLWGAGCRVESGWKAQHAGHGQESAPRISADSRATEPATPSPAGKASEPGLHPGAGLGEGTDGEGGSRSPRPRVRSALALFQAREGGGAWKPGSTSRGGISPPENSSTQASPPDRISVSVASPPGPGDPGTAPLMRSSPGGTHADPDTAEDGEDRDLPLVKVSELKKRFEA